LSIKSGKPLFSQENHKYGDDVNWVDAEEQHLQANSPTNNNQSSTISKKIQCKSSTIAMVESAFLASTASIIWLIDYYFSLGPLLKMLFPLPIALVYLRRGQRASWMTALVCGLLLTVLMGPPRSIIYLIPYGFMGVQLGALWSRGASWNLSLFVATIMGSFGFFFRFWLFSILLGEDLWVYVINQITGLADWIFLRLGLLAQPSPLIIQLLAIGMVLLNSLFYALTVHLVALLMLDRLNNPIPRPPEWIKVILDYD
jgi:uncharacterized protein YybS (DUF2232 family)